MNLELSWLKDILVLLLSSLIAFGIGELLKEEFGKDYSALLTYFIILIISFVPLGVVLFGHSNFNTEAYSKYLDFSSRYLIEGIVGVMFYPIWSKIILKEDG